MNNEKLKKDIYKQQPTAELQKIIKGVAVYMTNKLRPYEGDVYFNVPVEDMGDAAFFPIMEAKLLIRYLSLDHR